MTAFQWLVPTPLWNEPAIRADRARFRRPVLLRFASDEFVDDLQRTLATDPGRLRDLVARHETWRAPGAGLATGGQPPALYHPVHARFYLAAAALTCRVPGFPDHAVRADLDESVGFVVRRFTPAAGQTQAAEFAWVDGQPAGWVAAPAVGIADGEQVLPLFPVGFGANGSRRRLYAGVIPVGQREAYVAARTRSTGGGVSQAPTPPVDARLLELQRAAVDPWADLLDWRDRMLVGAPTATDVASAEQSGALLALDFASYLAMHVPAVWDAVTHDARPAPGALRDLYDALGVGLIDHRTDATITLRAALKLCYVKADALDHASFALAATPSLPGGVPRLRLYESGVRTLMDQTIGTERRLVALVQAALPTPAAVSIASRAPATAPADPRPTTLFVVRCVYRRPRCQPPAVVSDPSEPFRLASFFDPDAPARPLQVALPLDTTPAALRKYDKNVAFLISDELSKQLKRVKGLKQLMDGDLDGPGIGIGFICSLSIPIITICAFLVLMIFLGLLNLIFWWLPFFKICFPVPVLKAKEG